MWNDGKGIPIQLSAPLAVSFERGQLGAASRPEAQEVQSFRSGAGIWALAHQRQLR